MPVNLGHQLPLRGGRERREVRGLAIDLALGFTIICFGDAYVSEEELAVYFSRDGCLVKCRERLPRRNTF
jgi:hypothetical protein